VNPVKASHAQPDKQYYFDLPDNLDEIETHIQQQMLVC
jgi:hypothetical protein